MTLLKNSSPRNQDNRRVDSSQYSRHRSRLESEHPSDKTRSGKSSAECKVAAATVTLSEMIMQEDVPAQSANQDQE